MSTEEFFKNRYYKWALFALILFAFNMLPIAVKRWILSMILVLSPIVPIWGLTKWKKNSRLLNFEWIAVLVIIIIIWFLLLITFGPNLLFSLEWRSISGKYKSLVWYWLPSAWAYHGRWAINMAYSHADADCCSCWWSSSIKPSIGRNTSERISSISLSSSFVSSYYSFKC